VYPSKTGVAPVIPQKVEEQPKKFEMTRDDVINAMIDRNPRLATAYQA
jgi:hypothetical protein